MVKNDQTCVLPWIKNQVALTARLCTHWPHTSPHLRGQFSSGSLTLWSKHCSSGYQWFVNIKQTRLQLFTQQTLLPQAGNFSALSNFVLWWKVYGRNQQSETNRGAAAPLPPQSCQHRGCMVQTCTIRFQKLFVLHTFPRFPPLSSMTEQAESKTRAPHCICVSCRDNLHYRLVPAISSSCSQHNPPKCFLLFPWKHQTVWLRGKKHTRGGYSATGLVWPGFTVKYTETETEKWSSLFSGGESEPGARRILKVVW